MRPKLARRHVVSAVVLLAGCLSCAAAPPAPLPPPPVAQAKAPAPVTAPESVLEPEPLATLATPPVKEAPAPIAVSDRARVGIIHSLSGTLAAEETTLMNAARMAIDEINRTGGVLGQKLEPVVVDPASNWPLFAEKAQVLVEKERCNVVFGGHTSVSRKSMLPVFEKLNGLYFYPAQHEGEESSRSTFYTGSIPNQSVSVVADYLAHRRGKPVRRWFVIGTDYVVPRTQAKVLTAAWQAAGVADSDIFVRYTPFGHADYIQLVTELKQFASGAPTAVLSLLFAESAVSFQQELVRQGVSPRTTPVVSFGLDERGVAKEGALFSGTLLARSYFSVIDSPRNIVFKRLFADYALGHDLRPDSFTLNDDVEATYVGVNLWKQAVEAAKSFDVRAVTAALAEQSFDAPSGFRVRMDPKNHHLHKPYFVAEVRPSGKVAVVWKTPGVLAPIAPEAR